MSGPYLKVTSMKLLMCFTSEPWLSFCHFLKAVDQTSSAAGAASAKVGAMVTLHIMK